jgi:hypothetical protein
MTYERTDFEDEAIEEWLREHFRKEYRHEPSQLSDGEVDTVREFVALASDTFSGSKGTLGLALDFVVIAEELSQDDDWLTGFERALSRNDLFDRYDRASVESTLTLEFEGEKYPIRPVQDELIDFFRETLERTNFPSSPGHHTGEWERYDDMLEYAFQLSRTGRFEAAQRLFDIGLERLEKQTRKRRDPAFREPFRDILLDYPRSHEGENGGLAYQAMSYGYVKANWPHLSLSAAKVRVGSSRQNRDGDIDGYLGPDLMISVEVKDRDITQQDVESELGTMMSVADESTATAIAICRSVSEPAREQLEDGGVHVLDDDDLEEELETWDYHKQDRAVQGMIHYIAHVEEDPSAVQRLLEFLEDADPENTALAHLED